MKRDGVIGALLGASTVASLVYFLSGSTPGPLDTSTSQENPRIVVNDRRAGGEERVAELARQVSTLTGKLAAETAERRRLEERLESVTTAVAALGDNKAQIALAAKVGASLSDAKLPSPNPPQATPQVATAATLEDALVAAGTDAATAAEIKRRDDDVAMAAMYLRDQATREHWVDTPRFNEEMAEIESQHTSIRDQIGDDAYDRYLAALGQPNRVRVDDVMSESPAAQAGLQQGDVVLRYGDTRIFTTSDLVNATRDGTAGEMVQVDIARQGQVLEVEVPRGPLGLRIAASQAAPSGG